MKKTEDSPDESEMATPMALPNRLARLFRALTPYTQPEFGERTGIHTSTIGHYELGDDEPTVPHLEAMARVARTTVEQGIEMLCWHESLARPRLRAGRGLEALYATVGKELRVRLEHAYQTFLRLPAPASGKQGLDEQIAFLELAAEAERSAVVKSWKDFQTHALAERVARKAAEAPRDGAGSAAWASLAEEIASLAGTPKSKGQSRKRR